MTSFQEISPKLKKKTAEVDFDYFPPEIPDDRTVRVVVQPIPQFSRYTAEFGKLGGEVLKRETIVIKPTVVAEPSKKESPEPKPATE